MFCKSILDLRAWLAGNGLLAPPDAHQLRFNHMASSTYVKPHQFTSIALQIIELVRDTSSRRLVTPVTGAVVALAEV